MKKFGLLLLVLSLAAMPLFAGGQEEVDIDPDEIAGTITFGGWPAADEAVEAIIDGFQEEYPNVEVEVEMMGTADHHDRLLTSLAAQAGAPDVAMIEAEYIGAFRDRPGFVNLLEEPYNASQYEDDFVDYKWQHAQSSDGEVMVGLPWDIGPLSFFYNRRMFEDAGLPSEPDEVYELLSHPDSFLEAARALTVEDQQWAIGNATDIFFGRWANRDWYDFDLSFRFDSDESLDLIELGRIMREEGLDAQVDAFDEEWTSLIGDGRIAIVPSGSWFGGFLKTWVAPDLEGDWGVIAPPLFDSTNWGGSFLAIPEMSDNKAAAWAFVEYMLANSRPQNEMFEAVDYFPAYMPAWDDPMYDEPDPYFAGQRTRRLWAEIAEGTEPTMVTPMDAETADILISRVDAGIDAGEPAQQIIDDAIEEILGATQMEREALKARLGLD